jgi:hypothetical protein
MAMAKEVAATINPVRAVSSAWANRLNKLNAGRIARVAVAVERQLQQCRMDAHRGLERQTDIVEGVDGTGSPGNRAGMHPAGIFGQILVAI